MLNTKHTKAFALAEAQKQVPGIQRIGSDLLIVIEAAAKEAAAKVVKQAIAQHKRTAKTLSAPSCAPIAPSPRRRSSK